MAKAEFDFELEPIDDEVDMTPPAPVPERPRRVVQNLENQQTKIMERRRIIGAADRTRRVHPRGPGFFGKLFRFLIVLLIGFAGGAATTVYMQTEQQELYNQLLGIVGLEKPPADKSEPAAEENEAESNATEKTQAEPTANAQSSSGALLDADDGGNAQADGEISNWIIDRLVCSVIPSRP